MVEKARIRQGPLTARERHGWPERSRSGFWASSLRSRSRRAAFAVLAPCLSATLEHLLWPIIHPFSWFLFYPSVFFSAWVGGFWGGTAAAFISTFLAWWFFVPPVHSLAKNDPQYLISTTFFFLMGMVFSLFQSRLRQITDRAQEALSEALQASQALQHAYDDKERLIEQASDGILIADLEGRIQEANSAACFMLGYTRDEMRGQLLVSLFPASESEQLAKARKELEKGGFHIQEWSLRCKRGEICTFEASAKILVDRRWQIFLREISERKLAQNRLLQVLRANRALSRCNQALVRAVDQESLLQQVCDVVTYDAGYLLCWAGSAEQDAEKTVRVLASSGNGAEYVHALKITWADNQFGRGPTGTCIRTKQLITAKDIAVDRDMAPWRLGAQQYGYASSLAIPLMTEDKEVFGALNIYAEEPDAFHTEEVDLLKELAADLAFGITALKTREQCTRAEEELRSLNRDLEQRVRDRTVELQKARERELKIGSKIQEALLVDQAPLHLPGLCVASLSFPTRRIDGDFVIFMEPRARSFDVVIGDVMGKGVAAALLGAATKAHFIKAFGHLSALETGGGAPEPSEVVTSTHEEIVRQLIGLETFITLCYARIDLREGSLKMVDCGHTGVLHLHAHSGKVEMLHGDNLPLGVRQGEVYEQQLFTLQRGDLLLFFSDGITEAPNPAGEFFGPERLRRCIELYAQEKPSHLVQKVHQVVTEYCGADKMADDATLIAVRIEEIGPPLALDEKIISSDLKDLSEVRSFVRRFCVRLPGAQLQETKVSALELAANEAASNIMRHAYGGRPDRHIYLEAEAYAGRVVVKLRHSGPPFLPKPSVLPSLERCGESGFGLYILSQCVDDVRYCPCRGGENSIVLTCLLPENAEKEDEISCKSLPNASKM